MTELAHPSRATRPDARRCLVVPAGVSGPRVADDGTPYIEHRVDVIDRSHAYDSLAWNSGEDTVCFYGSTPLRAFERASYYAHTGSVPEDLPEYVA